MTVIRQPDRQVFIPPAQMQVIRPRGGAAVTPWYLAGGIPLANCVAAYQPKGAASLAASYTNLASPGTNDAIVGVAPTWDATNGWIFNGSTQRLACPVVASGAYSFLIRLSNWTKATDKSACGFVDTSPNRWWLDLDNGGFTTHVSGLAVVQYTSASEISPVTFITCPSGAYRAGVSKGALGNMSNSGSRTFPIGCRVISGVTFQQHAAMYVQAFAMYNINIGSYVSALTAAVDAL